MMEVPHRHGRDYWLRVAIVSVAAALVLTALLASFGVGVRISVLLRHTLIHSMIMAGLCGALMPVIRHRLVTAGAVAQWVATIPALLALAGLGSLLACGVLRSSRAGARRRTGSAWCRPTRSTRSSP